MFNQFRIPPWVHCLPCITEESTSMPLFHRSARSRSPSMPAIEKISSCVEERQQGKVSITSPPRIPCAVSLSVGYVPLLHLPIPYSLCKSRTPIPYSLCIQMLLLSNSRTCHEKLSSIFRNIPDNHIILCDR